MAEVFPHGEQRPLVDQAPRYDEYGNDIRGYTGEPVETEGEDDTGEPDLGTASGGRAI